MTINLASDSSNDSSSGGVSFIVAVYPVWHIAADTQAVRFSFITGCCDLGKLKMML